MKRRTPRFVTPIGLGDGHAGRDNSQQDQGSLAQIGHHHASQSDAITPAITDDIFRIAKQKARRNNPNQFRLRPTTNERLVRMVDLDEGRERRWDVMFLSSRSGDSNSKMEERLVSNIHEHWELSMTLVCVIVLISALFLHLLSSDTTNSSHHHNSHHTHNNAKPRRHRLKNKGSSGTRRMKKTDEWISDESASEEDEAICRADSDGQASTSTPNCGVPAAGTNRANLFYPYQPRHRKSSAGSKAETYGATYSPIVGANSEVGGFQSRNYYLTPSHGPVMATSYQSPTPVSLQARLSSPAHIPIGGTTTEQIQGVGVMSESTHRSPKQPHALGTPLTKEFVATGLEKFDISTPLSLPDDKDEESQHQVSESSDCESTQAIVAPPSIRNAVAGSQSIDIARLQTPSPARSPALPKCQVSYTHNNNDSYTAYGSVYSNNLPDSVNQSQSIGLSEGRQRQPFTSVSSHGMLSPRVDADMADFETPRAGMQRRTVDVAINRQNFAAGSKGGFTHGSHGASTVQGGTNNVEDPFQILRLPPTSSMGSWNVAHPYAPLHEEEMERNQQRLGFKIPMLPKLDPAAAAKAQGAANNSRSMPQSISVEELRLVQMESGSVQWFVRDAAADSAPSQPHSTGASNTAPPWGASSDAFSLVPSTDDDTDEFVETNEARKGIIHKRPNITIDTDAASSLQSSIKFDELNLVEVIGGGGFGQVWKAFWRGTPVAVKVLTGSAQAKHVSKAM
jgi:hypothetical protein